MASDVQGFPSSTGTLLTHVLLLLAALLYGVRVVLVVVVVVEGEGNSPISPI